MSKSGKKNGGEFVCTVLSICFSPWEKLFQLFPLDIEKNETLVTVNNSNFQCVCGVFLASRDKRKLSECTGL